MTYSVEQFAADIRAALQADAGAAGRESVRKLVQGALGDADFVATHAPPDADKERNVLFEDPDLGFCICAHVYNGEKMGKPHDHGPTWAIYGQADGETEMTDWRMVTPPADGNPGKVEQTRSYIMRPGDAHTYAPGDIHAPLRRGPTRLIRIEGKNTDKIERTPIEAV
jgi:predicted metal-dependent enzyme (double-stranded beta helix superfamily)